MKDKIQEIYINLDDSGKLTNKEKISVYGGIVFLSKQEKDKFITQYRKIITEIKCSYCKVCNNKCPEIKNTNIKAADKRRIMNYLKKYYIIGLVTKNDSVFEHIKEDKSAKGRFIDYSIRRLIKEIINELIKKEKINPYKPLKIIINIDEQSTKSNGYYNLKDGLYEELKYGILNYNYSKKFEPLIFDKLEIRVSYQDSGKSYVVQAADLLAGTIRKTCIEDIDNLSINLSKFIDLKLILP